MVPKVSPLIQKQLRAAVQDVRLTDECLLLVLEYLCGSPGFVKQLEEGVEIKEPYLRWWMDHTGGRSAWFKREVVAAIAASGPFDGLRVLDFGSGTGSSSVAFAEEGALVTGGEADRWGIRVAMKRASSLGVGGRCSFVQIPYVNAENSLRLPFADHRFDVVTLIGVLEHMYQSERVYCAREFERMLKPDGRVVVFDTPNRWHPFDHHSTLLWFVGQMPFFMARWWAIVRGRLGRHENFVRRGGTGISRLALDRLFPAARWEVVFQKPLEQVVYEFEALERGVPFLGPRRARAFGLMMSRVARRMFKILRPLGVRPDHFAPLHTVVYRRRRAGPGDSR